MPVALSSREKILLWLLRFVHQKDDFIQPLEVSQKGISRALSMKQTNVSREMSVLRKEGLLDQRSSHFSTGKRKMTAYSLTHDGIPVAREVEKKVMSVKVPLIVEAKNEKLSIGRVVTLLKGRGITSSPFALASCFTESGTYDLDEVEDWVRKLQRPLEVGAEGGGSRRHRLTGLPRKSDFFGRNDVLRELEEMLSSAQFKAVMVMGTAGMGKSALGREIIRRARKEFSVFYFAFGEWYRFDAFMEELLEFLGGEGRGEKDKGEGRGGEDRRGKGKGEGGDMLGKLVRFTSRNDFVIVLDDVHKAKEEAVEFLEKLLANAGELKRLKVIFLSREKERRREYDRIKQGDRFQEVVLPPLSLDECMELASRRGYGERGKIDEDTARKILRATGGIPLLVGLLRKEDIITGKVEGKGRSLIEEEIFGELDGDSARLLKLISLCTLPVEKDIVKGGREHMSTLASQLLVERGREDLFRVHDHIREVVTGGIGHREKRELRQEVLVYLGNILERHEKGDDLPPQIEDDMDIYYLEHIYHHIELDRAYDALEIIANAPATLKRGPPSHVLGEFLERVEAKLDRGHGYIEYLRAEMALLEGENDDARLHLGRARKDADKTGEASTVNGKERMLLPDPAELDALEKAIDESDRRPEKLRSMARRARSAEASEERIRLSLSIASQYMERGDHAKARKWLSAARNVLREESGKGASLHMLRLGAAYLRFGDVQEAVAIAKRGLRTAGGENPELLGGFHKLLGQIYLLGERHEKAEDRFNRAKLNFQRAQNMFQMADTMLWEVKAILGANGLLGRAMTTSFRDRGRLNKRQRAALDDSITRIREALLTQRGISRRMGRLSRLLGRDIFDMRTVSLWRQLLVLRCALEWLGGYDDFALGTCEDIIRLGNRTRKGDITIEGTIIKARVLASAGKKKEAKKILRDLKRVKHIPPGAARETLKRTMNLIEGGK